MLQNLKSRSHDLGFVLCISVIALLNNLPKILLMIEKKVTLQISWSFASVTDFMIFVLSVVRHFIVPYLYFANFICPRRILCRTATDWVFYGHFKNCSEGTFFWSELMLCHKLATLNNSRTFDFQIYWSFLFLWTQQSIIVFQICRPCERLWPLGL